MRADVFAGLGFATLGAVLAAAGARLPGGLAGVPGPGMFPALIGGVLIVLGLALAITPGAPVQAPAAGVRRTGQVLAIVALMACYLALWQLVPFIWRTPVFLLAVYRVLGEWGLRPLVLAAGATAILSGVFEGLLRVRL